MKHVITALVCALSIICHGQGDWTSLFQADPIQADGYFIVDPQKASALGVSQVEVDIIATELQSDGSTQDHLIETLEIDLAEGFFAQLDFGQWTQFADPFRVHYHARGLVPGGTVVVDVQEIGDGYPWPEVCRETCVSNLYAYTLVAYSNGALAVIELHEGTIAGDYTFVYVKGSNWPAFKQQFAPSFFGFGGIDWSTLESYAFGGQSNPPTSPYVNELKRFIYPGQIPPPDALDYMGYPLGTVTETVYAVKRGKGPWQQLYQPTSDIASQALYGCGTGADILRPIYNTNGAVQSAMAAYSLDPLTCAAVVGSGGGLPWGSGWNGWCSVEDESWNDLPEPIAEWVISILGCEGNTWPLVLETGGRIFGGSGPNGDYVIADVANVVVSHWTGTTTQEVLAVPVGSVSDPRLWPVKRTVLAPGLYDFTVVTNDGLHLKRFVAFDQHVVLRADFASFTTANIYPVPVTDRRFAIDIDLGLPTSINLTVVNNMGHQYYSKVLNYDLPGEHKHVVTMSTQWPNGIYHAIFQFPDGSSMSVSFTVSDQ